MADGERTRWNGYELQWVASFIVLCPLCQWERVLFSFVVDCMDPRPDQDLMEEYHVHRSPSCSGVTFLWEWLGEVELH